MKLLMIYTDQFAYQTKKRTLEIIEEHHEQKKYDDVIVGFIQVEKKDEKNLDKLVTKLIKNLKWAAKKNQTNRIIIHSFAHLSLSKAEPKITKGLLNNAETRLHNAGYEVCQTPFGYFLDLDLKAPEKSLARVFKEF